MSEINLLKSATYYADSVSTFHICKRSKSTEIKYGWTNVLFVA